MPFIAAPLACFILRHEQIKVFSSFFLSFFLIVILLRRIFASFQRFSSYECRYYTVLILTENTLWIPYSGLLLASFWPEINSKLRINSILPLMFSLTIYPAKFYLLVSQGPSMSRTIRTASIINLVCFIYICNLIMQCI